MSPYFRRLLPVCLVLATSSIQAQQFLPPVIDRSGSAVNSTPAPAPRAAAPAASQQNASSLEERVTRLERLLDNKALVDMLMRLDTLQTANEEVRGEVEVLSHDMEAIKQRQRDLYLDIDRRLRQVEVGASKATESSSAAGAPSTTSPTTMTAPSSGIATAGTGLAGSTALGMSASAASSAPVDPEAERIAYQKAFELLKNGDYDKAIGAFQSFLASYPDGNYTDNAQYWLGEANYVTRRFKAAEQEFRKVIELRPDSSKVSDAMLKLGYTYYELSDWDAARKTLENVSSRFPNSTVARLAENRLQKMRLEGR